MQLMTFSKEQLLHDNRQNGGDTAADSLFTQLKYKTRSVSHLNSSVDQQKEKYQTSTFSKSNDLEMFLVCSILN